MKKTTKKGYFMYDFMILGGTKPITRVQETFLKNSNALASFFLPNTILSCNSLPIEHYNTLIHTLITRLTHV